MISLNMWKGTMGELGVKQGRGGLRQETRQESDSQGCVLSQGEKLLIKLLQPKYEEETTPKLVVTTSTTSKLLRKKKSEHLD